MTWIRERVMSRLLESADPDLLEDLHAFCLEHRTRAQSRRFNAAESACEAFDIGERLRLEIESRKQDESRRRRSSPKLKERRRLIGKVTAHFSEIEDEGEAKSQYRSAVTRAGVVPEGRTLSEFTLSELRLLDEAIEPEAVR